MKCATVTDEQRRDVARLWVRFVALKSIPKTRNMSNVSLILLSQVWWSLHISPSSFLGVCRGQKYVQLADEQPRGDAQLSVRFLASALSRYRHGYCHASLSHVRAIRAIFRHPAYEADPHPLEQVFRFLEKPRFAKIFTHSRIKIFCPLTHKNIFDSSYAPPPSLGGGGW